METLAGRVALVTGAARGIGAAIAERLAKDGAAVVVNYLQSTKEAEAVVDRVRRSGGRAVAMKADVGKPDEAKALVDRTLAEFGRLDVLVNNAANISLEPIERIDPLRMQLQFATNVFGPIALLKAAAPRFPAEGGRVINITSLVQILPLPGATVYAATKGALDAMTRVWAAELGPRGVTVNAVGPGPTETDTFRDTPLPDEVRKTFLARTPLGRFGQPSDIADVVAFLASREARWVTGQVLMANGGFSP